MASSAVSSGQIKQNQSLFRSLLDSGSFLPILGTVLGVAGAGALADTISNMEGLTFNDLFQSGKAAIGLHTPSGLQTIARKTIQNAGNKIKDTGNKIRGKQSAAELLGLDKSKEFATGGQISPEFGGGEKPEPELQPTPEPFSEEEPEENQDEATPEKELEENPDEETPEKEPYQPFSKPEEEPEEDDKKKKKGEEPEKEKTPKELDQERAVAFQKGKNAQTNEAQKGKKGKDAKTEKEEKEKKNKEKEGKKEFTNIELIVWLPCAIIADIISIIPYVGLVVSWPFGFSFFIFKLVKKFNRSSVVAISGLDTILEGFLSTIPANTADVLMTYSLSKAQKYGIKIPDAEEKLKKIGGVKPK
ncbi:MAG: hypothetical protein CO137_02890 [Candidatus Magasanikbacteria bacterium CG_4_9_14_3_um_filter_32_9]|uniref:Uncharacterized protein n=1 Tax=Candidatus Magasanikbacteria bacterium CG_4_9_14_3_um_filter_32_9 TaxID=1974644 RepID=A0A2M7Z6B5_9BACT|nr:MAG: hypothetical protein CO137_02890 [Candidatus Magasanikbacteria bacterium CG_4_9_14_3_um_filter_32_9]